MNLKLYTPKKMTEGLLLSNTRDNDTIIEQAKTEPQKTFEFNLAK